MQRETGLELRCAFELEFQFKDVVPEGEFLFGPGFSLSGFRAKKGFGETFIAALRKAGVEPDSFLREWGDQQYEVTMHPQPSLVAADQALIIRELARATAQRLGEEITFTPLRDPDSAGNGVHIHMSLVDKSGAPVAYDPDGPGGLSDIGGRFVAGILHHLPDIVALTAPSVVSYARMTPHRWSAAFNNLGYRDREASMRICPVAEIPGADVARQYNVEFRAADSAAAPHLQLAALIHAGLAGIREGMTPPPPSEDDLSLLNTEELAARGFSRLPSSLGEAHKADGVFKGRHVLVRGAFCGRVRQAQARGDGFSQGPVGRAGLCSIRQGLLEHFVIENIYPDKMLWWCEAKRNNAREVSVVGLCPASSGNLKRKML